METLGERIASGGPLNELDAVGWAIRLAKRLEQIHAIGIPHGKVSPACLLIDAVDRTSRAVLVAVEALAPQIAYHSPERASAGGVSVTDDAWGLAATLYTALTGSPPFGMASDEETRQKILAGPPPPLAVFDVGDDDLERILAVALARDPAQRTTTVAGLRKELERWHPDRTVVALPAVALELEPSNDSGPLDEITSDSDGGGLTLVKGALLEDDDDARTLLRPSPMSPISPFGGGSEPAPGGAPRPGFAKPLPAAGRPADASRPAALQETTDRMVAAPMLEPPDDDDDEDDIRTIMRPSLDEHIRAQIAARTPPGQAFPSPGAMPGIQPPMSAAPDDDEDDIRTVMREAPAELRAALAHVPGAAQLGRGGIDPLAMTAPGLSPPGFPMPHQHQYQQQQQQQQQQGPQAPYQGFPPPQQQQQPGSYPGGFGQGGMHTQPPAQPMSQWPYGAPMPAMPYQPLPRRSGAGLAIVVAILALLVAAGATFLYLRLRAGASPFG